MQECQKRRIDYKKMPIAFKRSKINKSIYLYKEKSIYWDIDFIFPYCNLKNEPINSNNFQLIKIKRSRISENLTVGDIINQTIHSNDWMNNELKDSDDLDNIEFTHYKNSDLMVFFKSDNLMTLLDQRLSLKRNLENKTILEYPILMVILKQFSHLFT